MPRVKEEPRGPLAALQEMLSGGSQVILDQAQSLRDEVQRRLGDVASGLEEQMELESRVIADRAESADGREGVEAFMAKRKPEFS